MELQELRKVLTDEVAKREEAIAHLQKALDALDGKTEQKEKPKRKRSKKKEKTALAPEEVPDHTEVEQNEKKSQRTNQAGRVREFTLSCVNSRSSGYSTMNELRDDIAAHLVINEAIPAKLVDETIVDMFSDGGPLTLEKDEEQNNKIVVREEAQMPTGGVL